MKASLTVLALMMILTTSMAVFPTASHAVPIISTAHLTGPAENPSNTSPGIGNAIVSFDAAAHLLGVNVTFSNLTAGTIAAHIHCCINPPGNAIVATAVPTFPGFPLGVTA
jgi:hypothetical protein